MQAAQRYKKKVDELEKRVAEQEEKLTDQATLQTGIQHLYAELLKKHQQPCSKVKNCLTMNIF